MSHDAEQVTQDFFARHRGAVAIVGLVLSYAAFNAILFTADWFDRVPEMVALSLAGCCAVQPLLLGMWGALGPGPFILRLPFAINALFFVILAIGVFPPTENGSPATDARFVLSCVAIGVILFGMSVLLGAAARWWSRQSIRSLQDPAGGHSSVRFGLRFMLGLTTVCAITLAVAGRTLSQLSESVGDV